MTTEPPRDSLAWALWKTRQDQIARFGHFPRRSLFGTKCLECGRTVYNSHPDGLTHSPEGASQ